jgi:hypothetical protein
MNQIKACQNIMRQSALLHNQVRLFSSLETIEKATQKLNKALDSEIKYENENYSQLEDIETYLNESGF